MSPRGPCGEVISYRGAEQINDAGTVKRREAKRIAAIGVQRAVGNKGGSRIEKRLSLVRLPARVWPSDHDL